MKKMKKKRNTVSVGDGILPLEIWDGNMLVCIFITFSSCKWSQMETTLYKLPQQTGTRRQDLKEKLNWAKWGCLTCCGSEFRSDASPPRHTLTLSQCCRPRQDVFVRSCPRCAVSEAWGFHLNRRWSRSRVHRKCLCGCPWHQHEIFYPFFWPWTLMRLQLEALESVAHNLIHFCFLGM